MKALLDVSRWNFRVIGSGDWPSQVPPRSLVLRENTWNDFGHHTTFDLYIVSDQDAMEEIGTVKIASVLDADRSWQRTKLPPTFDRLQFEIVSLGQDAEYYERLVSLLGLVGALDLLSRIRDLTLDPARARKLQELRVISDSVLRYVGLETVETQFSRILRGGPSEREYQLQFQYDGLSIDSTITMRVDPESILPTNLHVLIGANGAGKTRTLREMRGHFSLNGRAGVFKVGDDAGLVGVLAVSFSTFDDSLLDLDAMGSGGNLPRYAVDDVGGNQESYLVDFVRVLGVCRSNKVRRARLAQVIAHLDSDRILSQVRWLDDEPQIVSAIFSSMSSGHKIVMLSLASMVARLNERTLVLIDEPETHLHPPLLAAYMRALSWLLTDTNGLAVVATHSPVVLQEVPTSCAWRVWSVGNSSTIEPLGIPTFGENVGRLTRAAFGLEVERSGHYRLLRELADRHGGNARVRELIDEELGLEARLLLAGAEREGEM